MLDRLPVPRPLRAVIGRVDRTEALDRAAMLAFRAVAALVPALLIAVSVAGLLVDDPKRQIRELVSTLQLDEQGGVAAALETFLDALDRMPDAGALLVVSTLVALWTLSGAAAALVRSIARVHGCEPADWATSRVVGIGLALVATAVIAGAAFSVALAAGIGAWLEARLELDGLVRRVFSIGPYVVVVVSMALFTAIAYRAGAGAPGRPRARLLGVAVATVSWSLGTLALALYVSRIATLDRVYGPVSAVFVVLLWLYASAFTVLLGAAVDASASTGYETEDSASTSSDTGSPTTLA